MKKENCKQRTVIEWLEGELSATKDDKFALQNKLTSIEQRIYSLLRHKGEFSRKFSNFLLVEFCSYSGRKNKNRPPIWSVNDVP